MKDLPDDEKEQMRILLIGGTGNISGDFAELMHRLGHQVIILSRGNNPVPSQFTAVTADRKNAEAMKDALKNVEFDIVVNFLGYFVPELEIDFEVFRNRVRQYIFISTAMVYAKPHRQLPITENAPVGNKYSDYAQNKEKCENWLMERFRKDNFPVTIVRPSHTYSRLWIPNPISSAGYTFVARLEQGKPVYIHDEGKNPWTLTATTDFAAGLAGLVGNGKALGEAFHITSDEALPWYRIYEEISSAAGVKSPNIVKIPLEFICGNFPELTCWLKGDKAEPAVFDNSKIKRFVPGFTCGKPASRGIRESVEWMRAHPEDRKDNPKVDNYCDRVVKAWRESVL